MSGVSADVACAPGVRGSLFDRFRSGLASSAQASDTVSYGNGYGWLDNLNQQGQQTNYWCGPATVSESTVTEHVGVSQATAASYMGTTTAGTGTNSMLRGMQHFVGYPVRAWYYYYWVDVNYYPTSSDQSNFWNRVQSDIYDGMPLAGNAYEVYNGPHLVGHPNSIDAIGHYIEIGGYWYQNSPNQVYYADSATTVWSTVPPYSWIGASTMVTIIGGKGYIW
jgi:hypothetical protein